MGCGLLLLSAGCGGSSLTADSVDFGPVGSAVWVQLDLDDDATGALTAGEVAHAVLLTDDADGCATLTAAIDACEDAVDEDSALTAAERCELGDNLYEDLADAFEPLYGAGHRTATAFFWEGDGVFDEPAAQAYTAGADPEDDGVALRLDLFTANPFDAFADAWDEDSCGADPDLRGDLDVYLLQSGRLTIDGTEPLTGNGEGALQDKDGDAAGNVSVSFAADACEIRIRNSDAARCAAFALPPLAFAAVGGTGTPGPDNVTACKQYVVKANQAYEDCGKNIVIDPVETCPADLNDGRDCLDFFDELGDSYMCTGEDVTFSLPAEPCEAPA